MFVGLCARAERTVGLQKEMVLKGDQPGKCWIAQNSMILFPKWSFVILLQGLANPHLRVSIIGESWDNITVSTPASPSKKLPAFCLISCCLHLSLKCKSNSFWQELKG